jgi:hypothetical protein
MPSVQPTYSIAEQELVCFLLFDLNVNRVAHVFLIFCVRYLCMQ